MGRKRKTKETTELPKVNSHWVVSEEFVINGRHLVRGTEVSIKGERGRFRFIKHVYNPVTDSEWIDVVGGPAGHEMGRSFRPERVRTVHIKKRTRQPKSKNKEDVE
jgi:hypothetical protein